MSHLVVRLGRAVDNLLGHVVERADVSHHANSLVEGAEPAKFNAFVKGSTLNQ